MDIPGAAVLGARVNRLAGHYANPTPATQVMEVIRQIPKALEMLIAKSAGPAKEMHA